MSEDNAAAIRVEFWHNGQKVYTFTDSDADGVGYVEPEGFALYAAELVCDHLNALDGVVLEYEREGVKYTFTSWLADGMVHVRHTESAHIKRAVIGSSSVRGLQEIMMRELLEDQDRGK